MPTCTPWSVEPPSLHEAQASLCTWSIGGLRACRRVRYVLEDRGTVGLLWAKAQGTPEAGFHGQAQRAGFLEEAHNARPHMHYALYYVYLL